MKYGNRIWYISVKQKKLLDKFTLDVLLNRLSCELIENHFDFRDSILIGLQPRGTFVLNRLVKKLKEKYLISNLKYGKLDTTFSVMILEAKSNNP